MWSLCHHAHPPPHLVILVLLTVVVIVMVEVGVEFEGGGAVTCLL